jgi:signal transduction histidine kinase
VRFDDRLMTVLNQPAGDRHDTAVRWRQLVDLVARAGPIGASPVVAEALDTIRSQATQVDDDLRAAAARAVAARALPLGLLEYFAADKLTVSAPVLAAASLDGSQWRALLSVADDETRRFVETLHPEVASAPPPLAEPSDHVGNEPEAIEAPMTPVDTSAPTLSEVVARIERRRRSRGAYRLGSATPTAMPEGAPSLFRWESGPNGEIAWVDGAPRGAVIGRSIARAQDDDGDNLDDEVVRAFAMRAPFRDAELTVAGDGLLAGAWKISGLPAFEPTDGRFAGYRGIALRDTPAPVSREISADLLADPDSLRELVHEIKTPLNAIIGFAEIIEGQYLGPADHRYRSRAAEIVGQARLLLNAIDDLDFAAKVHSSAAPTERYADLSDILARVAGPLSSSASAKSVEFEIRSAPAGVIAKIEPDLAERLVLRLGTAVIARSLAGEHVRLGLEKAGGSCRISFSKPAMVEGFSETKMTEAGSADNNSVDGGSFAGFTLRLVRGLARIAGGDLHTIGNDLTLSFPSA